MTQAEPKTKLTLNWLNGNRNPLEEIFEAKVHLVNDPSAPDYLEPIQANGTICFNVISFVLIF